MKQLNLLETNFVPYEVAVKMKQLGYKEMCLGNAKVMQDTIDLSDLKVVGNADNSPAVAIPTWSAACEWLYQVSKGRYSVVYDPKHSSTSRLNDFTYKLYCVEKYLELEK